ncbi:MAG: phage tail protein [Gammaproteobacteria bacterium]|nr:phage tail protein [Gammaproteobacteria bacterium]MDH5653089.1 phage tail protein [Gammaproteobacteria bacterium]
MAEDNTVLRPFTTFNFEVIFINPDDKETPVCEAEFSECDGLEMSIEPKTIREGGNNGQQVHLAGPTSYGQLSLKRGMTKRRNKGAYDLWRWFEEVQKNPGLRLNGEVIMYSSVRMDKKEVSAKFKLIKCMPVKLKAPALNAKEGQVAIEEMQIAYESVTFMNV